LRTLIIGLGNQGRKRLRTASSDAIYTVDPFDSAADFSELKEVPLDSFDAALVCTPENVKMQICKYLIANSKHVMCEKPLTVNSIEELNELEEIARSRKVFLYTAYNHRFEPALIEVKRTLESNALGSLYSIRLFYGNGTAQIVKSSKWRDSGSGVIQDLIPHLLDLLVYWNLDSNRNFKLLSAQSFETKAPDHAVIFSTDNYPRIELEVTLCKWKNMFRCDILAENGSLHIDGLMKWGSVNLQVHRRVRPSGVPEIVELNYPQGDPTWDSEYKYFKSTSLQNPQTDLSNEKYIRTQLISIENELRKIL